MLVDDLHYLQEFKLCLKGKAHSEEAIFFF